MSDLQKWANWPAKAGSKKWAENQETFRLKQNFPISKKLAELTSKKLTSGMVLFCLIPLPNGKMALGCLRSFWAIHTFLLKFPLPKHTLTLLNWVY